MTKRKRSHRQTGAPYIDGVLYIGNRYDVDFDGDLVDTMRTLRRKFGIKLSDLE